MNEETFFSVSEISKLFDVHELTVRRWINSGKLKKTAHKITPLMTLYHVAMSDLLNFAPEEMHEKIKAYK